MTLNRFKSGTPEPGDPIISSGSPHIPKVKPKLVPLQKPLLVMDNDREGVNSDKFWHTLGLVFKPRLTKTMMRLDKFGDLPIESLIRMQIRGLIIDVDGTLTEHHNQEFKPEVIAKLHEVRENFKACFFSNNADVRPELLRTGIPFVHNVPAKPDPIGFELAARLKLGLEPYQCAMVGDNFITDGGCRKAGMPFIHVKPIPGPESFGHRLTRSYGIAVANLHDWRREKKAQAKIAQEAKEAAAKKALGGKD